MKRPVAAFAVAAGGGVIVSAHIAAGPPILERRWALLLELGVWAVLWAAAVVAALRLPRRLALPLVLLAGVALRVAALAGPPVTSTTCTKYA